MTWLPLWLALEFGDDSGIVEGLLRRDQQAMASLYDKYGRVIYSLILRIVRDTAIAEDLTQETFLRVWNRMAAFDPQRGTLGSWVITVARNRAIDYVRSVEGRMTLGSTELLEIEHPSLFTSIEADLIGADQLRRIQAAFAKLDPRHKQVLELAYLEGLSQTEIAARLNQPLGTIKTWVRTALRTLREELGTDQKLSLAQKPGR
ncbi:MAG: sigma-70 family RNA polymerase sigma factor [Bryobacteraceae bacterium]